MTETQKRQVIGGSVFVLLALYLCFPDKVYVFDGIMFSGVIERAVDEWRRELFNPRHVLFNPALMLLRDLLGKSVGGYVLIQKVNAVAGAIGIFLFYALVRKLSKSTTAAVAAAAVLAVSSAYWSRATEGQVYMLMTLGGLSVSLAAARMIQAQTLSSAVILATTFAVSVLFHAANIALAPLALLAAFQAGKKNKAVWLAAPAAGIAIAVGYALAFGSQALTNPFSFLSHATEQSSLSALAASSSLISKLLHVVSSFGEAVFGPKLPIAARQIAGGILLLAGAFATKKALKENRQQTLLMLAWAGGVVALEALWFGGRFFWAAPVAALLAIAAIAYPKENKLLFIAPVVLGAWNLWATIIPQSKLENNVGYARSMFVRDHTVASSWVVISGFGFPNQKVYLPYFARRSREVLEYYLTREPKPQALARFNAFIQGNIERGIPLYLLPDLINDEVSLKGLQDRFGVSPQDIQMSFGSGDLLEVARQDATFRVYLFAPERRRDRLFAVLGYSVLTETDANRLPEEAKLLQMLGQRMSPADRRSAVQVMKSTNYGAQLLVEGFGTFMSPESRKVADERLRRFAEYQKSADFHLRLGNILRYLGATSDVKAAWTRAYQLSGDKGLLEQIKAQK